MIKKLMAEENSSSRGTRFLVIAAAIVIIIYGINQAQSVVALFLVSVFLALIGTPPVLWMERKHVPSFVAVMIVIAVMITLLLTIGAVVGSSLNTFSEVLPFYQARMHEQVLALKALLATKHVVVTEKVLAEYLNPGSVISLVAGFFAGMSSVLSDIILVLLTVTFILLEASSFPIKLRSVLGDPQRNFPQVTKFVNDIRRYMIIKTIISLIAGVTIGLWLYVLGVDFPILWGFVAFLLHYIPNLGQILAAIPAVLLALLQLGPGSAALAAAGYLVVGFTLGNVVEPRLMGRQLGLSTLVVFLSLMLWGGLLGPIGVVLCVPITMSLKFAFESSERTQWIAVLLGSEKSPESILQVSKKGIHSDT
ncbi:MAG: AI-2E family transporter [Ignavibacteriales bacterium]|nr:AI-2E family transporter [Ignavibacteriales bacterium]